MPLSDGAWATQQATRDGPRLLVTDELSLDDAQASGRWLAARYPVAVER